MKLYFAGGFSGISQDRLKSFGVRHKLYSFHGQRKQAQTWGRGSMLDSGAFTAFTRGVQIDMDELNEFILKYKPEVAIQLDVIGDEKQTWRNFVQQKTVVDVLPVIHSNASKKHIERVLQFPYICIGGLVGISKTKLIPWIDYIFSFKQAHKIKIHALGISNKRLLERYPFYSCDSTSALLQQRYPQKDILKQYRKQIRNYKLNYRPTIKEQLELEEYITRLWARRGITWDT